MRNVVIFLVTALFTCLLFSCNPILNTSIIEPLPEKQWTKISKQDTLFDKIYPVIREMVLKLNTPELRSKYEDLTYKDMLTFFKYTTDYTCKRNSDSQKDYIQWKSVYGTYSEKADSVISHWENQYKENIKIKEELSYYYRYYVSEGEDPSPVSWNISFRNIINIPRNVMDYLVYKYNIYNSYQLSQTDFKTKIAESFSPVGYESEEEFMSQKLYERNYKKFPKQIELMTQAITGK